MSLPALPVTADTRSISERVNVLIREHNNPLPPQRLVPPGVVLPFAGAVAPAGFLLCDGQAVSRTVHADLFAAIGTTYGAGDGSTTFNVPDLRGRVAASPDGGAGRLGFATAVGAAGGTQTHAHTVSGVINLNTGTAFGGGAWNPASAGGGIPDTGHQHNVNGAFGGTSSAQSSVQPTLVLNHVIST